MSDDVGTTPIIADLKGRRVLVTGRCAASIVYHVVLHERLDAGRGCLR